MNTLIIKLATKLSLILLSSLCISNSYAQNLTDPVKIISKANLAAYYPANDGRALARMKIVDAQGNKQLRQFTILRKDKEDQGDQDILVFFSRPSDVSGTVFRVQKKVNSDDNRWLYLPALDLVKRISAGDKRTSFVGAHFYYEDVSGRNPKEDNFELLETNSSHYVLKGSPKQADSVEFAYYQAKIDKNTFLPMQVTYFNQQGKAFRKMQVLKTKLIKGIPTVLHSKISQLSDGSYTEMQFKNIRYNLGLPEHIFSERSLRAAPKKWMK